MSNFPATDTAFTGIRFVRERPVTVAIWAGAQIVIAIVFGGVTIALMGTYLVQLQDLSRHRPVDLAPIMALLGHILPIYALILPISLAIHSVLYATMARAVLRPSEDGLGYIRFGMDEARQALLILLGILVVIAAEAVATLALVVLITVAGLASKSLGPLVGGAGALVLLAAMIYGAVRLSLGSALTFDSRRVNLFGSWTLTRGRFWKLLGAYLLALGVGMIILVLTVIIAVAVAGVLGGIGAMASVFQSNAATLGAFFLPARLAVTLIWAIATPLFWALFLMPPVEIYRQLRPEGPEPDATFD